MSLDLAAQSKPIYDTQMQLMYLKKFMKIGRTYLSAD